MHWMIVGLASMPFVKRPRSGSSPGLNQPSRHGLKPMPKASSPRSSPGGPDILEYDMTDDAERRTGRAQRQNCGCIVRGVPCLSPASRVCAISMPRSVLRTLELQSASRCTAPSRKRSPRRTLVGDLPVAGDAVEVVVADPHTGDRRAAERHEFAPVLAAAAAIAAS